MSVFSKASKARLETCAEPLQRLMEAAIIKGMDFSILCGERTEKELTEAFNSGHSKVKFPNSKHNKVPSEAVDIAPWPIAWDDIQRFKDLALIIQTTWNGMPESERDGYTLEWGGSWQRFKDYPHFQITKEKK